MSRPQAPGALNLPLQRGGSVLVGARPTEGVFVFDTNSPRAGTDYTEVILNRSEFAALHAAMGELLAFYREEALDR